MKQQRMNLMSGNTIGALYYTDGKMIAPMLPDIPHVVKCPKCGAIFKITSRVIKGSAKKDLPDVKFLSIEEYRTALDTGLYNAGKKGSEGWKEDKLALRLDLWRAFNDRVRNNSESDTAAPWNDPDEKAIYEENCRELLSMMNDGGNDTFYLLSAELHRNLGEFDDCRKTLQKLNEPEKYEGYVSAIIKACEDGYTMTFNV